MSNTLEFGQALPSQGSMYLRVKNVGEYIQFRIGQNPTYVGKHFMQKENGWDVTGCPRVNSQEDCEICDLYFKAMAEAKKLQGDKKEADLDAATAKKVKDIKESARPYGCSITFYFPVINRDTGKFGILQTTSGVRNKINEFHENGTDVLSKEFVLRKTDKKGRDLYSLTIVDSADAKTMSPEDLVEYEKAQSYDMSSINDGLSQSDEIE